MSAKLPPFDGKNGPTKCCNRTLCDLFRQIWIFFEKLFWAVVKDKASVFLKLSQNVLPSSPCDSGFRWMNDRVRLTCQPTLSTLVKTAKCSPSYDSTSFHVNDQDRCSVQRAKVTKRRCGGGARDCRVSLIADLRHIHFLICEKYILNLRQIHF